MADTKEKVICPWCKEEMRPYPHQGYYWFQCKCGARTPTLWHATEERARERALSYTADVAPKSEVAREILFDLKHQIHDKAVYPHNAGIDAYITLKAFDAILQNYLNGLK